MHPRVAEEWSEIASLYPGVRHMPSPQRVEVDMDLEAGMYDRPGTSVAVLIPPGYRATSPDGFLVPSGLSFADGSGLPASDATGVGMPGWLLVSFHLIDESGASAWRPAADFHRGDNLIGYLASIESFLARRCN
jgi:hypothetical protein